MSFVFANPAGFWALLGIPVILLIHFLQRQSRTLPSSTLFLLDAIDRQSLRGRKVDRIRNSVPLWLQLLGVVLLTWLLTEPRWNSENTIQRVVLVLDSSASMEAFREEAVTQIGSAVPPLVARATETEYTVLESHLEGEKLYRGQSLPDLLSALEPWQPSNSAHSPESALRVARSLAGTEGTLVFVTDHIDDSLPYGASLLSVGKEIDNVGFAGLSVSKQADTGETTWQVTVRNYSESPQTREWFLTSGQSRTNARSITLDPGATRLLSGKFPDGTTRAGLVLEPDQFSRDDRLFLIVPEPKLLSVAHSVDENALELVRGIIGSMENTALLNGALTEEATPPDLVFSTYNPLDPQPLPPVSLVFLNQKSVPQAFFGGPIINSNHVLMENLNWQGLIAKKTASIPLQENDIPILWQGERALIVLREQAEQRQLIFNFDVVQSNASRLPAFIVLVNRFVDHIRSGKIAPRSENAELGQTIDLAFSTDAEAPPLILKTESAERSFPLNRAALLQAPDEPGFFTIRQGSSPLLFASANFADTREADFSSANSRSDLSELPGKLVEKQTVQDSLWQLWVILMIVMVALSWHFLKQADHSPSVSESI